MSIGKHLLAQAKRDYNPEKVKEATDTAQRILDNLFPQQRAFVEDPSRRKAALCPRRAGKSFVSLSAAIHKCLTRPNSKVLIVAKVRRQAKSVYWKVLRTFNTQYSLGLKMRNNELSAEFPNGSEIYFTGADTTEEIDKFRGAAYDMAIIDEGKSYSPALLEELIEEILMPALMDTRGNLMMIGTPGAILGGTFYEVTTANPKQNVMRWDERDEWGAEEPDWTLHRWTTQDNTAVPWIWEEALAIKRRKKWSDQHPTWQREYLGIWVPDDDAMVYSYHKANEDGACDWEPDFTRPDFGLPEGHHWRYLLGVDLGYSDATAFVIAAWSDTHTALHYIHCEKHNKLNVEELAAKLKNLEQVFGIQFDARIADTGNLAVMITQTLSQVYGIPLIPAKKTEKHVHIKMLNADMEAGRIKVPPRSPLAEEWATLAWQNNDDNSTTFRKREDPSLDNHAADAALYLWRYAYHHFQREGEPNALQVGSEDWWKAKEKENEEKLAQEVRENKDKPFWKKYTGKSWTASMQSRLKRW